MQNYINYNLDIIINCLTESNTAAIFTCIILLVFIIAFILLAFLPEKRAYIANRTPGILIMMGLVGTFLRIAQNFDSDLPALLENIKLSIWTAILGMICAVIITLINYITGIFPDDVNNNDSEIMILVAESIEDSVNAMQKSMIEHSKKISSNVQSLGQGINDAAKLSQALPKVIANLDKVIADSLKKIRDSLQSQPNNIESDFKQVESAMEKQINQISEITAKLAAAGDSITKYADKITDSLKQELPRITESITGILQAQSQEIAETSGKILESILTTGVQNIESEFTKSSAKINNILNKNVKTLERSEIK